MYKPNPNKMFFTADELTEYRNKAFDEYNESRSGNFDNLEHLKLFEMIEVKRFINKYDRILSVLDARIQDFLYLKGYRNVDSDVIDYQVLTINQFSVNIDYMQRDGYRSEIINIPIEILTDPNFLNDYHAKVVEAKISQEKKIKARIEAKEKAEREKKLVEYNKLKEELGL